MTDTKQSRLTATLLCVTPPDEHQEQGIRPSDGHAALRHAAG